MDMITGVFGLWYLYLVFAFAWRENLKFGGIPYFNADL